MWHKSGWRYRKKITVDHTKVAGSSNLVDFPFLLAYTDSDIFGKTQSAGEDIVITDSSGNKLAHEIEKWDTATARMVVWIKIPSLSPIRDTILYIYYGNAHASDQADATNVWNSNFKAVFHLSESGSGALSEFRDSTNNAKHAQGGGGSAAAVPTKQDSQIGFGQSFNTNDYINTPSITLSGQSIAISAWIEPTSFQPLSPFISTISGIEVAGGLNAALLRLGDATLANNKVQFLLSNGAVVTKLDGNMELVANNRYHIVGIYNGAQMKILINGVQDTSTPQTGNAVASGVFNIARSQSARFFNGRIDENKFSTITDPNWWLTEYNNQGSPQTFFSIAAQESLQQIKKHYFYKIFDAGEYVTTWTKEVTSEPNFRMTINGGPGELNINLARPFDEFGEDVDVKLNNKVECWCVDKDQLQAQLIYSGYISGYRPIVDEVAEYIDLTVLGYVGELQRMILRDASGNTTLTYSSADPSNILKDIITKYRTLGGNLNYTNDSVLLTNTTVSYSFNTNTIKECLDKIIELCPVGWFFRIDPDNLIYLQPKKDTADHSFSLGLEIEKLNTYRRIEDLVNRVVFTGGGEPPLFRKYENTGSQDQYGLYEKKIIDQRVTVVATAEIISERIINQQKDPEIRSTFVIVDNNGPGVRGYDIESIKVGQTLQVKNLKTGVKTRTLWDTALWDVDVWDASIATSAADVIQILSLEYTPDSIKIEASSRLPQIAKRIEDIQRNLENTQTVNNPTAPS